MERGTVRAGDVTPSERPFYNPKHHEERPATVKLTGQVVDEASGLPVEARVQVLTSGGQFVRPSDALLKVGPGLPFFYCDGKFEVDVPRGRTSILVERGTEYNPRSLTVEASAAGCMAVDIALARWTELGSRGHHPGNTHIHYNQHEQRPDDRLRLDPRVEDLRVTAISILRRWDLPYASNKYAPGVLTDFSSAHHYVECGEECRHNDRHDSIEEGYGHVMFLRLTDEVKPMSRGFLVDDTDPDYPPLCFACDDARRQGGLVIWCHNGRGMEAPVAAALGKLDAFNLFDPYWMDPEYDLWYAMLNCGWRLPASTGSDWFICSANRVYVDTGGAFEADDWFSGLKAGRTFITNGPAVFLDIDGTKPGDVLELEPGVRAEVRVAWESFYAVEQIQVICNGNVVYEQAFRGEEETHRGEVVTDLRITHDAWVAARLGSNSRDSFFQPIYAHTSPVYITTGRPDPHAARSAAAFARGLDTAIEWIGRDGRFHNDQQRREVIDLFREGKNVYDGLAGT